MGGWVCDRTTEVEIGEWNDVTCALVVGERGGERGLRWLQGLG